MEIYSEYDRTEPEIAQEQSGEAPGKTMGRQLHYLWRCIYIYIFKGMYRAHTRVWVHSAIVKGDEGELEDGI